MSFTDNDLITLKSRVETPDTRIGSIMNHVKIRKLIQRLEAAEKVCSELQNVRSTVKMIEVLRPLYEAWREAAGK